MSRSISSAPLRRAAVCACAILLVTVLPEALAPLCQTTSPAGGASPTSGVDYAANLDKIFETFYRTGLDLSTPYLVSNLSLRKDSMALLLKQGTIFLMQPIAGEVTGAVFIGDGEASTTPPNRRARVMLRKYNGSDVLKEPFTEAVLRFSDDTEDTIRRLCKVDPSGSAQAEHAATLLQDRNGWLNGSREIQLEMHFLENRLSNLQALDFFTADLHSPRKDWLLYQYDPGEVEEHFLTSSESMGAKGRRYFIPWMVWHKQKDYSNEGYYHVLPNRDGPRVIKIKHQDLTVNLTDTKTVRWQSSTTFEPQAAPVRAVRFDLVNNADPQGRWQDDSFYPSRVTSVTDAAGSPLPFLHKKDQLLVLLPAEVPAGSTSVIKAAGSADVTYQVTPESFGILQAPWFPQYGYNGGRSSFHWTVRVPKQFSATGSGRVIREEIDKGAGQFVLETVTDFPVNHPWVIFGQFTKSASEYSNPETGKKIGLTMHTSTIGGSGSPTKKVDGLFEETKQILSLFEKVYGPYPYEELHIAQMGPGLGFGQGPPYFVQLTGEFFLAMSSLGSNSVHGFLSHEVAHQWWGNQIGWASDQDEWLSEGFAEYAAGTFIQALQKEQGLQRVLDEWRQLAKNSDKEAPISAANTLNGPNADRYRTGLLYSKAPYVLHMLRVQLTDDVYASVMRKLQENYRGMDISTEVLVSEVNKATGQNLTYFFDQWVWDTGIPTLRYSWRSDKQPDGKFLVTVHVSQDDKANFKKILLPIHLHLKDKTIPQYKLVVQPDQDIKFMLPVEPKNVTLDDDRTLLADIVKAV